MARGLPPVTLNSLDRLIGYVSPRRLAQRIHARQVLGMMAGGGAYTSVRKRGGTSQWAAVDYGPNAALLPDLPDLRAQSREIIRTTPLARGAVNTVVTNTVDTGLQPRPVPNATFLGLSRDQAAKWKAAALAEWWLWAGSAECDLERTLNFGELQALGFRASLTGGDSFAIKRYFERIGSPYGLKLQMIAGDRVSNPHGQADRRGLQGGVEYDINGAPIAYHVSRYHPGELLRSGAQEWDRVPAFGEQSGMRQVLHLYNKLEPEQLRGEPYLAPVVDLLRQLGTYTDAELQAAVVNSCFAVVSKTEGAQGVDLEGAPAPSQTDGRGQPINIARAGQVVDLAMNESIESFSPERPATGFDPFVQAILRQIGVALELPFEVLIKHFTSSYSAARAALLEVWKFYRGRRAWLTNRLCQPAYEALITEAVARGRLEAPGFLEDETIRAAYLACEWHGPSPGHIDPLREAQALETHMRIRTKTLAQATIETTGGDTSDTLEQIEHEIEEMQRRGIEQVWSGMAVAQPAAAGGAEEPARPGDTQQEPGTDP